MPDGEPQGMRVRRVTVTLSGAENDKEVLRTAMRMAAQDGAELQVYLAHGCTHHDYEKHVDFALWDVEQQGLEPPPVIAALREA